MDRDYEERIPADDATSVPSMVPLSVSCSLSICVMKNIRPGPGHSRKNDFVVSKRCDTSA